MDSEIRTIITFKSTSFNVTEPKDYFINACCFGDDLAHWMIDELNSEGIETDKKPGQEDFGWYLNFQIGGTRHTFVVTYRPDDERVGATWIGWLERNRGLVGSLFGGRKRGIHPQAIQVIHRIVSRSPQVRDVCWHFQHDFDKGHEQRGASSP